MLLLIFAAAEMLGLVRVVSDALLPTQWHLHPAQGTRHTFVSRINRRCHSWMTQCTSLWLTDTPFWRPSPNSHPPHVPASLPLQLAPLFSPLHSTSQHHSLYNWPPSSPHHIACPHQTPHQAPTPASPDTYFALFGPRRSYSMRGIPYAQPQHFLVCHSVDTDPKTIQLPCVSACGWNPLLHMSTILIECVPHWYFTAWRN